MLGADWTHLTDGGVLLFPGSCQPVSCELHGQAKVTDHTGAIILHQDIAAIQVPMGHCRLVGV